MKKDYILKLSCPDQKGIVAAIATHISSFQGNILDLAQYSDPGTRQFFMRLHFEIPTLDPLFHKKLEKIAAHFSMHFDLHDSAYKPKVILFCSKQGHCLNDLLHRYASGSLLMEIAAVISNHTTLKSLVDHYQIPFYHIPITEKNRQEREQQCLSLVLQKQVDLVILARYMQILSDSFCTQLQGKIINIHHSFLPSFKGAKPYHQAYQKGVKVIGATAHYVTADLDEGPIIEQEVIRVNHTYAPKDLIQMGCDIESIVLARAVKYHLEHRVFLNDQKTVVFT